MYTCADKPTCVANIKVVVGDEAGTVLDVCDVFEFDEAFKVKSIFAYKV